MIELLAEEVAHATDKSQGHRKVESRSFFANVSGSEVDGDALAMRKLEAAIAERRLDALTALFNGIVREANDVEVLHAGGTHVDFHFDEVGVDAVDRGALCFEEHGSGKPKYNEGSINQ